MGRPIHYQNDETRDLLAHILMFINGSQVGDNATFAGWYADDAAAVYDTRSYITAEGYAVQSI